MEFTKEEIELMRVSLLFSAIEMDVVSQGEEPDSYAAKKFRRMSKSYSALQAKLLLASRELEVANGYVS